MAYAQLFPGDLHPRVVRRSDEDPPGSWPDEGFTEASAADHADDAGPEVASLRRELRRYRYKLGYTLTIRIGSYGGPFLVVTARLPDSRFVADPDRHHPVPPLVKVTLQQPVPEQVWNWPQFAPAEREAQFAHFIRDVLKEVERHEMLEWFRRDGELVEDPHAKEARR